MRRHCNHYWRIIWVCPGPPYIYDKECIYCGLIKQVVMCEDDDETIKK